jgi:hypothetical protein
MLERQQNAHRTSRLTQRNPLLALLAIGLAAVILFYLSVTTSGVLSNAFLILSLMLIILFVSYCAIILREWLVARANFTRTINKLSDAITRAENKLRGRDA